MFLNHMSKMNTKKVIVIISLLVFLIFSHCQSGVSSSSLINTGIKNDILQISKTVELALVIASLTSFDLETNNSINRADDYFIAVENHFKSFKDHPVIRKLSASLNLPRLVGNAADFSFNQDGQLIRFDTTASLWGDEKNNLFITNLDLIQDFATKSDFLGFFASQNDLYTQLIETTNEIANPTEMVNWLKSNFSVEPKPIVVFISPLMSGYHWTTLYKDEQRIWMNPPRIENMEGWNDLRKMKYNRMIFTELDHGYVNPVTAKNLVLVQKAFSKLDIWGNEGAIKGYRRAELIFNEYMTWSVFLLYANDKLHSDDFEEIESSIVTFMEERRGFIRFGDFSKESLKLYRMGNKTVETILVEMIKWSDQS